MRKLFPYQSDSLDGFFTYLNGSTSYFSTFTHPEFGDKNFNLCLDRKPETYCHTNNSDNGYFLINLKPHQFKISGYNLQNRNTDNQGYHNILNWDILGSNDGISYDIIHSVHSEKNDQNCSAGLKRSFKMTTETNKYSFIKIKQTGTSCGVEDAMNVAEFEMFGEFFLCNAHQTCKLRSKIQMVIFMIFILIK